MLTIVDINWIKQKADDMGWETFVRDIASFGVDAEKASPLCQVALSDYDMMIYGINRRGKVKAPRLQNLVEALYAANALGRAVLVDTGTAEMTLNSELVGDFFRGGEPNESETLAILTLPGNTINLTLGEALSATRVGETGIYLVNQAGHALVISTKAVRQKSPALAEDILF